MSDAKVTIACCNRNGSRTLADAITSALAQSFTDFAVLLIDDASTDDSVEIMQRFADKDSRVRIVRHASQRGLAGGQNTALEAAGSEFLALIDADDLWHRDKIARQLDAMSDDAAAVGCLSAVLDRDGAVTGWRVGRAFSHSPGGALPGDPVSGGSVALLRTEALRSVGGFDESLSCRPDWDMWLRLARDFRLDVIPEVLVGYRRRTGGLSSDYARMVEEGRQILRKAATSDPSLNDRATSLAMARDTAGIAGLAVLDGAYGEARMLFRLAAKSSYRSTCSMPRLYVRAALTMGPVGERVLLEGVTRLLSRRRVGLPAGGPFPIG